MLIEGKCNFYNLKGGIMGKHYRNLDDLREGEPELMNEIFSNVVDEALSDDLVFAC